MKATGIVRRIDELGRIVIPKEIRKNLRIHEGESIEIYVDTDNNIILKKFSMIKKLEDLAQNFAVAISSILKHNIIITDTDVIIAMSGNLKQKCINQPISSVLESFIKKKENIIKEELVNLELTNNCQIESRYIINSIIVHGDVVGLVILISEQQEINEIDKNIIDITSNFLSKYLEE